MRRADTVIWNVVPWYLGSPDMKKVRAATKKDIESGLPWLLQAIERCPSLLTIVLFGQKAHRGWDLLSKTTTNGPRPSLPAFRTWPTSPQSLKSKPKRRDEIVRTLAAVGRSLR